MGTRVVHCKKEPYDVYIGRPSRFGNPHALPRGASDQHRQNVITLYEIWFGFQLGNEDGFAQAVEELRGKTLGCWCKPKACHGDVIVDYLEKTLPNQKQSDE